MQPKTRMTLTFAGIALLAVAGWWVRSAESPPKDRIEVAGHVSAEYHTVVAPALAASATPAALRARPTVSGQLAAVTVRQGDHVVAGQVVAQLDTRLLDLGVDAARAAAQRAEADVALMGDNLDTIARNQTKLADARGKLASGRTQLTTTRTQLVRTRADLIDARAKALAGRDAIQVQIRQLESIPTTLTPQQQQMLSVLKSKLAEVTAGIAKIDAGRAKVDAGLAKIDAALAKLPSASRQLATARSTLSDAKGQVSRARSVLRSVARARHLGVDLAIARRDSARLTSPVTGTVTYARAAGTVAMVGAPVVRIRPDGPQLIDTYLTGEQLQDVVVGKGAEVRSDSLPGRVFSARIARIGAVSDFPPTGFPTRIVHMTRTVRVTAVLDEGSPLPFGTPVDLTILTSLP